MLHITFHLNHVTNTLHCLLRNFHTYIELAESVEEIMEEPLQEATGGVDN